MLTRSLASLHSQQQRNPHLNNTQHQTTNTQTQQNSLHKVHEEDGKPFEIEMSWICDESNRVHERVPADVLAAAEAAAKAALEESDMED